MKFREKYAVKIDLYDAFVGGIFLYFSTYLIAFLFGFTFDWLWGIFNPSGLPDVFQQLANGASSWLNTSTMPYILALVLTIALMTFLVVVLFEEHYFSKHEKGAKDLVGLGLVWGTVFIAVEAIMNSGLGAINILLGSSYLPSGIRVFTSDIFFWPIVLYIIFLPWLFHYSKKGTK